MSDSLKLLGVVLCGGKSTRMGRNKAELPHPAGGSYLEFAIRRLHPLCDQVCIAGDNAAVQSTEAFAQTTVLRDPVVDAGPVAGLAAAMAFARQHAHDAILLTPVDTPLLTTHHLQELSVAANQNRDQLICAISHDRGRRQPLLAIYPAHFESMIEALLRSPDRSLDRWIDSQTYVAVPLPAVACQNINTPEDHQRACEISL